MKSMKKKENVGIERKKKKLYLISGKDLMREKMLYVWLTKLADI